MSELIVVYVTVGTGEEADRMAQALVGEQLAACVNRVRSIQSVYRWQGKIEQNDEELLIIKTRRQLFPALEKRVKELHSYSVPEIIGLPIIEGSSDYLTWLREQALAKPPQDENIRTVREVSAGGVIYRRSGELFEVALIHVRNRCQRGMSRKVNGSRKRPYAKCARKPVSKVNWCASSAIFATPIVTRPKETSRSGSTSGCISI
jgi:periplasmic divalent cation tolerance protein